MKKNLPPLSAEFLLMAQYQKIRVTPEELADILGIAVNTIYNQISAGSFPIPTYKEGKSRYADIRDVGAYLDKCRQAAA